MPAHVSSRKKARTKADKMLAAVMGEWAAEWAAACTSMPCWQVCQVCLHAMLHMSATATEST